MRFVTSAARDAQHGCRILWRSPGYAAVVILTIALGIGANVTIFSVILLLAGVGLYGTLSYLMSQRTQFPVAALC